MSLRHLSLLSLLLVIGTGTVSAQSATGTTGTSAEYGSTPAREAEVRRTDSSSMDSSADRMDNNADSYRSASNRLPSTASPLWLLLMTVGAGTGIGAAVAGGLRRVRNHRQS